MTQQQPSAEHRERLVREVRAVQAHYRESNDPRPISPGLEGMWEVEVRLASAAYRHASFWLFRGCLIDRTGLGLDPGVILLYVTPFGLDTIADVIQHDTTPRVSAELAAIASIEPHRPRSEQ